MKAQSQVITIAVSKGVSLFLAIMLILPLPQGFSSVDASLTVMTDSSQPAKAAPPTGDIPDSGDPDPAEPSKSEEGPLQVVPSGEERMEAAILTMINTLSNEVAESDVEVVQDTEPDPINGNGHWEERTREEDQEIPDPAAQDAADDIDNIQIPALEAQKAALLQEITDLEAQKAAKQTRITEIDREIATLQAEIAVLTAEINNLTNQINAKDAQIRARNLQINFLAVQNRLLSRIMRYTPRALRGPLRAMIAANNVQIRALRAEIATIRAEKMALVRERNVKRNERNQKHRDIAQKRQEKRDLQAEIRDINQQIADKRAQITVIDNDIAALRVEAARLRTLTVIQRVTITYWVWVEDPADSDESDDPLETDIEEENPDESESSLLADTNAFINSDVVTNIEFTG